MMAAGEAIEWAEMLLSVRTGWSRAEILGLTLRKLLRRVELLTPKK